MILHSACALASTFWSGVVHFLSGLVNACPQFQVLCKSGLSQSISSERECCGGIVRAYK